MNFAADLHFHNQRWSKRRHTYVAAAEVINTSEYDIAPIAFDHEAKQFVIREHYSGSYVAARFRFGLYHRARLVGVAVFSHPCNDLVLTNTFPGDPLESCELGRFVLLDEVPGNGESWFAARCFHQLRREGIIGVVSFSDPEPRTTESGERIFAGHIGTIYQSLSARFVGRSTPRTLRLLPDGKVFNDRTAQKIRSGERGWQSSAAILEMYGATKVPTQPQERREWFNYWRARLTRQLQHPGNYKYVWGFTRAAQRALPVALPYPKITRAQLGLWN
jgi:hypothetical protein